MTYIFNTSFYVHPAHRVAWNAWVENCIYSVQKELLVKDEHIKMFEVVSESPDGFLIFSLQWQCENISQVGDVDDKISTFLMEVPKVFGDNVSHFSSIMKQMK